MSYPPSDAERVIGQIVRGEIHCGRDAARAIAARHQDAYGGAFHGTPAEALLRSIAWGDVVAAMTEVSG